MFTVYGEGTSIRYTQSKDSLTQYVFFFEPPTGEIVLQHLETNSQTHMELLGSPLRIKFRQSDVGTVVRFPKGTAETGKHVWVIRVTRAG